MKYNIILEWNMRNSKDVLGCMNKLSKKGYKNEASGKKNKKNAGINKRRKCR